MPTGPPGADVDRRLRPVEQQQPQDPTLVGGELREDALVGGMRLLHVVHVARFA
jgi:hypothetical protein